MNVDEIKVWIRVRKLKSGKLTYHLRWICPTSKTWKSRKAGGDRKRADREAALLEKQLTEGTYSEVKKSTWEEFTKYHTDNLTGAANKAIAKRTLEDFAQASACGLRHVTKATVKAYVARLREKKNSSATINKAVRYLRHAFNVAVDDGFMPANPITRGASKGKGWKWEKITKTNFKAPKPEQEQALIDKALELGGIRMQAFVYLALHTGGRAGELLGLEWSNVSIEDATLTFTNTKDAEDRTIYLTPATVEVLRKVHLQTQQQGGPFRDWTYDATHDTFCKVREAAGMPELTIHDLRRCFVTNLIRAGVELSAVQKLAGHSTILTTLAYYNAVHESPDLRAATARLAEHKVG